MSSGSSGRPSSDPLSGSLRKVALLRGINVGRSPRISMDDLRACTEAAGGTAVTTVLATGNVLLTDPRPVTDLRAALEAAYAQRFDYRAVVQVVTLDSLAETVTAYPFDTLEDHHDYVVFSDDPEVTDRVLREMHTAVAGTEAVATGPLGVYWRVPRGSTLSSDAAKVLDSRENKRHLTTRNLRTLARILAAG
ncbi:DUF1697 domain-containing protein [Dietzia sp. PP-33]|jgi:uncharacterized protein (DUF1697 family)|uniref:DUF1697 domain-containing protein n=1 Tax=Dietzia sp. PP-33 TaxID=2957500 RepID=UPI0029AA4C6B|nr:DUF1697 domain-containing protein [Dietzia sp. PP-33]MDX2356435.1 DUF1697 domain-containing protein [Dietzia sp. PP-33]